MVVLLRSCSHYRNVRSRCQVVRRKNTGFIGRLDRDGRHGTARIGESFDSLAFYSERPGQYQISGSSRRCIGGRRGSGGMAPVRVGRYLRGFSAVLAYTHSAEAFSHARPRTSLSEFDLPAGYLPREVSDGSLFSSGFAIPCFSHGRTQFVGNFERDAN